MNNKVFTFLCFLLISSAGLANSFKDDLFKNHMAIKSHHPDLFHKNFNSYFLNFQFLNENPLNTTFLTDGFEDPTAWAFSNPTVNQWVVGNAVNNGGNNALYISNDEGATNTYTTTATKISHAYRNIDITEDMNIVSLNFDWRCVGQGFANNKNDYFRVWLTPSTFTPMFGIKLNANNGKQLGRVAGYNNSAYFVPEHIELDLSQYSGQTMRIVFEWVNDFTNGEQPPAAIDNLSITNFTCGIPNNLTIDHATGDSIKVNWNTPTTGEATYDVYLSINSQTPTDNQVVTGTSSTNSYTFENLNESTTYNVWVRTNCDDQNATSFWVGPLQVTTTMDLQNLPYNENFEGNTPYSFQNDSTNKWIIGNGANNGGEKALYISNNELANEYAHVSNVSHVFKDFSVPIDSEKIQVSFDWRCIGEKSFLNMADYFDVWVVPTSFTPIPGTRIANVNGGFKIGITNGYNLNTVFKNALFTFNNPQFSGSSFRLVFEWINNANAGEQPPAAIDNLFLKVVTCNAPTNLGINNSLVTANGIGITWSQPAESNAIGIDYYYSTNVTDIPGLATQAINVQPISGSSTVIPNLTSGTQYYIWIRNNCGATDGTSIWTGPVSIYTACDPIGLPFWEGFNTNSLTKFCWKTFGTNTWNINYNDTDLTYEGNRSSYIETTNYGDDELYNEYLVSPPLQLNGNQQLKFHYRAVGGPTFFKVMASTTGFNPSDFTIEVLPNQTYNNLNHQEMIVDLDQTNGQGISGITYIAFVIQGVGLGDYNALVIDNVFVVDKPECIPNTVNNLFACGTASNGTTFNWSALATENQWELFVAESNQLPSEITETILVNEPTYLLEQDNLVLGEEYALWIRSVCEGGNGAWTRKSFYIYDSNISDANPFCAGGEGIVFPNVHGKNPNVYGQVACLGETPNPVWYFLKIDQPGDLVFDIIQNTEFEDGNPIGDDLDVDYVAFGPFNDLSQACMETIIGPCPPGVDCPNNINTGATSPYPIGNIVDCSFDDEAVETLTILNAQSGQIYAVLITNYDGDEGFIKLQQTNLDGEGSGSTDCKFLCEVTLGENIEACLGSEVTLTAYTSTNVPEDELGITFKWYKDDMLLDETIYNTKQITVTETGVYKIEMDGGFCEEPSVSEVQVNFTSAFQGNVKTFIEICDLDNDGFGLFDLESFVSQTLATSANVAKNSGRIYSTAQAAEDENAAFEIPITNNYNVPEDKLFLRIDRTDIICYKVFEIDIKLKSTIYPIVDFEYPSTICLNNMTYLEPTLDENFTTGGKFSYTGVDGGLYLDSNTGAIDLSYSLPGKYTINYSYSIPSGSCGDDKSFSNTIEILNRFQISYQGGCVSGKFLLKAVDLLGNTNLIDAIYLWTGPEGFTSSSPEIETSSKGIYTLLFTTKDGCYENLEIDLSETNCMIQKGISPNGDGLNDFFDLKDYIVIKLSVFNRYGTEVYSYGSGYTNEWYGQGKSSNLLPDGTYFYEIQTLTEVLTGWIQINK